MPGDGLQEFGTPVQDWFRGALGAPTEIQRKGWPVLRSGKSALLLAPTGSGKTLAAFLAALDGLSRSPEPAKAERLRVLYVSPLKALANDIERNLKSPIAGIERAAERAGHDFRKIAVAMRTGDTPSKERARFLRAPSDILITTPESLFLLLTSQARECLAHVETVIVDEIHSLAGSKRGSHLVLSLERLERLRAGRPALQRIGLSATQRPLEEIARLLGGAEHVGDELVPRPVQVIDCGARKSLELSVEVTVDDMTAVSDAETGPGVAERSIWPSIYPRLVERIRAHRSTMVFVNSRRLAERLAAQINEVAGEEIALAHHGSVSKEQRAVIEDRLKTGDLPAIVATSSLELGIDMGAVELVIQIEAPPSVSSGMQRVGRAGHSVGQPSRGLLFPKHRGDLLPTATVVRLMEEARVESTRYPRNPLDVLAQQIVATTAMDDISADALFALVRQAAPFAELPRESFEGVLDMLSGRYPSDEFAELRPRITWDRVSGMLRARRGAKRLAVVNAGTIPDRGLYGVFLSDGEGSVRVGELDEEMVFESRPGEVFVLGASSWRISEITHDRVLVTPAPGEPGRMPFWHGDRVGRSAELGAAVGALGRVLVGESRDAAEKRLREEHGFDSRAGRNLLGLLAEQSQQTGLVPSDCDIVVERFVDEIGDFRVCLLSPYGARVHAPWALAVAARARRELGLEVESVWSDDGIVFRFPEADAPPELQLFVLGLDEVEALVVESLGQSALFAARFRENAGRALLLPKRFPGKRSPLWAQRKRAADLLRVAARFGSFPILLETYRECLRDVFDLPALTALLERVQNRSVRVTCVDSTRPSAYAKNLLFGYVANFMYDGDAPLAERRAQALVLDQAQLRELLGEAELRQLFDPEVIEKVTRTVGRLDSAAARDSDGVHDLLLALGPLTAAEIECRAPAGVDTAQLVQALIAERRAFLAKMGGEQRLAAMEDASRLRDALGVALPLGVPRALSESVADPLGDLVARYARTHGPFLASELSSWLGIGVAPVLDTLRRLAAEGRVVEGEFLPSGVSREWCGVTVLRLIKGKSLSRLRKQVEPVEQHVFGRFLCEWHAVLEPDTTRDALHRAVDQLQGAPLVASELETHVLPARVGGFAPAELDLMCARGEIVWRGLEALGPSDGRIALYPKEHYGLLAPRATVVDSELARRVQELLSARGALFFDDIVAALGGFAPELLEALWDMVWAGQLSNDSMEALRSRLRGDRKDRRARISLRRPRRDVLPGSEGRWVLLPAIDASETERRAALCSALLERWGVLPKEAVRCEGVAGGFSAIYPVLKAMEEAGRARRGYFVAGLGATQFARPGAEDRLRAQRTHQGASGGAVILAATDPANAYGSVLAFPEHDERPMRAAGARVVLLEGRLVAYVGRGGRSVLSFLPPDEPERGTALRGAAEALSRLGQGSRSMLIERIDGRAAADTTLGAALLGRGFVRSAQGLLLRPRASRHAVAMLPS
jgi:ATP-dependent Lhr-like helicase